MFVYYTTMLKCGALLSKRPAEDPKSFRISPPHEYHRKYFAILFKTSTPEKNQCQLSDETNKIEHKRQNGDEICRNRSL